MDVSIFWHLSRALMTSMMCSQASACPHVSGLRQEAVGLHVWEGGEDVCLLADTVARGDLREDGVIQYGVTPTLPHAKQLLIDFGGSQFHICPLFFYF